MPSCCRRGAWRVSSTAGRIAIVLLPLLVIAAFWALSIMERRVAGHPGERGFFQRNGVAISLYLLLAVGIWALMLIVRTKI